MKQEAIQFGAVLAGVLIVLGVAVLLNEPHTGLLVSIAMLIGGIYFLIKGSDVLVHGAVRLARLIGVSPFFIGLTVVAFGTSAPELAASIGATLQGQGDLAIGNVLGSNIANICLILGATALVRPIVVERSIARVDTPIMIGVSLLALIPMLDALVTGEPGRVSRLDGALLVLGLVFYVAYNAKAGKMDPDQIEAEVDVELNLDASADRGSKLKAIAVDIAFVLLGLAMLVGGAKLLVDGAVDIAQRLNVPSVIIGLTVVAIGTSVPELAFSLRAALKGHPEIALGNVVGSNVFNLLSVVGIASLVKELPVPVEAVQRDIWAVVAATILIWPLMVTREKISRIEGGFMLAVYFAYIIVVFVAR
ncbi:MAG: calcium/sodium antiporter [Planctomycetota bacterium]